MDPRDLTKIPNWMNWDPRPGKHFKAPLGSIHKGMKSYETALRIDPDHVGFVITRECPFTVIDLDVKTKAQEENAQKIISKMNSYTEISQSGKGYHIWLVGKMIQDGGRRNGIEVYSTKRFMIVTWNSVHFPPREIEPRQPELESLIDEIIYGIPD